MFSNLLALKLEYAMSVYQKFRDCKTAGPFLCPRMIWFSRARVPHTLTGRGKSPFHPLRSRCFVSAWVLDLRKITGWLTVEKVPFLWSTIYPANFGKKKSNNNNKKIGHLELVPFSISPFLVVTFDKTISYWILGSLRSTSYKILVTYTHTIGYQMVYPNDQNPKNLVLFYLLPSVPEAACGKSPELCVKQYHRLLLLFVCLFFFLKSVGIPVFLLMQCKSGSLCFLHKLLNETA